MHPSPYWSDHSAALPSITCCHPAPPPLHPSHPCANLCVLCVTSTPLGLRGHAGSANFRAPGLRSAPSAARLRRMVDQFCGALHPSDRHEYRPPAAETPARRLPAPAVSACICLVPSASPRSRESPQHPAPAAADIPSAPTPTEGGPVDAETLEFLDSLVSEGTPVEGGLLIPTERRLAEASGMSRAAVRERLSGLQMLGMLQKVQGRGNILVTPSFDGGSGNVFELMLRAGMVTGAQLAEAREMLEIAIAPRMVERVTDEQIQELEELVYAMID